MLFQLKDGKMLSLADSDEELADAREQVIKELISVIRRVYEINERGGPGSRKEVRELLTKYV